jgi:type IV secretion system protein VirB10
MRQLSMAVVVAGMAALAAAQEPSPDPAQPGWRQTTPEAGKYLVEPGTKVPLALINSISTKNSARGDRIYLETVFPILVNGRVVIPPGSYVAGTVTEVKRPGRIRGRGELFVRFDSLTLPNGVTRDFRARIGSLDGRASEELDRAEGKVRSEGNKGGDARTVGEATAAGTSVGVIAGHAAGRSGMGAGVGAAAGATAGLVGVLLSRGPDAVLAKGSTIEMVLDRPLRFEEDELDFGGRTMPRAPGGGGGPAPQREQRSVPMPGRRWP